MRLRAVQVKARIDAKKKLKSRCFFAAREADDFPKQPPVLARRLLRSSQ
jgi:hypothetical protein